MQFKVPQFLDIEDKLFGPFTFRQFVYLAGGAGFSFMFYKLLGLLLGAIPIIFIGGFSLLLAFYRPNNKPFLNLVESGFKYFTERKLYIWKRPTSRVMQERLKTAQEEKKAFMVEPGVRLSGSKLRDLAWSLDVLDLSKQQKDTNV